MKIKLLSAALLLGLSLGAQAEFVDTAAPAGSKAPRIHTVKDAKAMFDGSRVVLEGYITGRAGTRDSEEYFFKDDSGTIKVEIDDDVWHNQTVNPQTKVRIIGEVDHNLFAKTVEIEVDRLSIVE